MVIIDICKYGVVVAIVAIVVAVVDTVEIPVANTWCGRVAFS